ncbi:hypothetical protein B9Z55_003727 [Caenorhabditis nigoni]|uniref:Uncharacterized protein n=1 Tax=Caenorhabditis nigoni TaxID=1611254 RepID=A0A2G5VRU2_9PELO|nr:hypothetical protein B9Z55_003727 [Caenorhabditis nigoni]
MNNLSVNGGGNQLFAKPTIGRSEYGRVKVALAPGKGLMDWLRLTTNKHLAKRVTGGVDHVELMKHDKEDDCWVHLFGRVYDVTKYLEFHPGGIPELLRGAGRDATPLFNQYHAWVNYESFLKACLVGPFIGDLTKLPPPLPPTTSDDTNKLGLPPSASSLFSTDPSENGYGSRLEFLENGISIEHDDWTGLTEQNVVVSLLTTSVKTSINTRGEESSEQRARLRILIHHFWKPAMKFEFEPNSELIGQKFDLKIEKNRVEFKFPAIKNEKIREILSREKCKIQRRPGVSYHAFRITNVFRLNHDTTVFSLEAPEHMIYRIPMGHHVSVKVRKGNAVLYRPYTPIASSKPRHLDLMIKIYPDGICTPSLENLKIGDKLEISDPIGEKDFTGWVENSQQLILLAAGSGLTPMIDILERRIQKMTSGGDSEVYMLMFNKTEKDIQTTSSEEDVKNLWKLGDFWKEYEGNDKIVLRNILSAPKTEESEHQLHGRVSGDLLQSIIATSSGGARRAFICGPDGFIIAAKNALDTMGISSDHVHIFQG